MRTARTCLAALVMLTIALLAMPAHAGGKDDIRAGNQAARGGDLKLAIKHYTKALADKGLSSYNRAVAHSNRGSAYDDLGEADKAVMDFNLATAADPKYAPTYYNRSYTYERKGQIGLAYADIKTAVKLEPDDEVYRDRLKYLALQIKKGR